jgi:hypothetical protein
VTGAARTARALPTDVALVGVLCGLKLAIDACVLHLGFSHVSDDDYARTVIAERFAFAPHLDPSATSWLPLPFWLAGGALRVLGRSLESARMVAVALGVAGVAAPFAAMRASSVPRPAALAATFVGMSLPWSAWLDTATVPDGWTAALIAAGAITWPSARWRPWGAVALLLAALSRYEAWPACAVFAVGCGVRGVRAPGRAELRRELACAAVAVAGPALWMAWNAYAHGSPVHFVARVTAFRRAIGAADVPVHEKLLGFPRALVSEVPEAAVLGVCGVAGVLLSASLRRRWAGALGLAIAIVAFLVIGDLGDGAPTHHPARALGAVAWILIGAGVDALGAALGSVAAPAGRWASGLAATVVAGAWIATLPARWAASPGNTDYERRDAQVARGLELRRLDAPSATITPCQFEHFALLAAWGEPERARVDPRTGAAPTSECPRVRIDPR